jgi:hypothetical protein
VDALCVVLAVRLAGLQHLDRDAGVGEPLAGRLEPDPDAGHRVLARGGVLDVDDERAGHGGGR